VSRIGKEPVPIPSGVDVTVDGSSVTVKGPKGELTQTFTDEVAIKVEDDTVVVERFGDEREQRALHGLTRSLISNMVTGVSEGFSKNLEIHGVGYRAALKGKDLEMQLGFSHPVLVKAAEGITFEVPSPDKVIVNGIDKQQVGQVAAEIRDWRRPEPYKGKGVRYEGEYVRRKVGKTIT
jgi:large subunit ribosomal protein L6